MGAALLARLCQDSYLPDLTSTDLLAQLREVADDPTELPSSAAALSKRLRLAETSLATQGVRIDRNRSGAERTMTLTFGCPDAEDGR